MHFIVIKLTTWSYYVIDMLYFRDPPFVPKPSIRPVCEYLIKDCMKRYPLESCPLCKKQILPEDPTVSSTVFTIQLWWSQEGWWVFLWSCVPLILIPRYWINWSFLSFNNNNNHIEKNNSRFFTISSLRHKPSPTCTLKWPGHNCVQIACIEHFSRAARCVPCGVKGQLSD